MSFTEGGSALPLDKDSDSTVKVDSAHGSIYTGGSVTASIYRNIVASEDVLEIAQTGGSHVPEAMSSIANLYWHVFRRNFRNGINRFTKFKCKRTNVAALIKAITYKTQI